MTKLEFINRLRDELHGLPNTDIAASLDFYAEAIDDRMEAGATETEAVAALGTPEAVAREILLDRPLATVIKRKCKKKNAWRAWEIVLLVLGSPIWLPLLLAAGVILLSVYIVLWTVVASLWAVDAALAVSAIGLTIPSVISAVGGQAPTVILYIGAILAAAGLAIFGFFGCLKLTVLFARVSAVILRWVKSLFIRKEKRHVER